jgi:hypothetical protein
MATVAAEGRGLSLRRILSFAVLAALLATMGVVWLQVVRTLTTQIDRPAPLGQPESLAWGGRVFRTQAQLEAWLRARDISYAAWAAKHRAAVAVLEHRRFVPPARTAAPRARVPAQVAVRAPTTLAAPPGRTGLNTFIVALLWVLVTMTAFVAVVPARVVARYSSIRLQPEYRTALICIAASIGCGLLIGSSF